MVSLTPVAARAARCRAQLLTAKDRAADPVAVARHMLALQGQNAKAARWAVGMRTRSSKYSDVEAALESGALIRTWPMRGTHHIMAAEDVDWLTRLCAPRAWSGIGKRREALGLTAADVTRSGDLVADAALDPGRLPEEAAEEAVRLPSSSGAVALTRAGVHALLATIGIDAGENRGSHMLRYLCEARVLVQGPPVNGKETFTAFGAWVPAGAGFEGEEAVREVVVRHATARGPVTDADIAWWTGLPVTLVRRGIADAGDELAAVDVEGREHVMAAASAEEAASGSARPPRNARLLPAFDEYLLGYGDRSLVLDPADAEEVGPGPAVLAGGRIAGMWSAKPRAAGPAVEVREWVDGLPGIGKAVEEYRAFAIG
ncbi:winged helix DNA-binding domain-containing protein [Corynebacterium hansenii]|uniref:Winged helix DNA-binding domain-containing protein n=1 Tax=Corynebacterium hansenii TaxID=394964 RepID=A0ABV7ZTA8_9CORY|nr:winged helix DNA-binding domain-containing protein [Corynebacterium hansenii]WJZ00955.1 hypothetical protein CHAN_11845 [Corynebacterium hansenii]